MNRMAFAVLLAASVSPVIGANQIWPAIVPMHVTYSWMNPGKAGVDTPFVTYIRAPGGARLYKLECHDGDYDDDSEINFSGVFQCALFALQGDRTAFADLLAADTKDEQSTDWWDRGRVMAYQLQAPCLSYPEYSTARHFRLRGMLLTLGFSNIYWSRTIPRTIAPEKFTMTVDAVADASAMTPQADLPNVSAPAKVCYP